MERSLAGEMKMMDQKGFLDVDLPEGLELISEIKRLKKEKKSVLLAHYYQKSEIQE